MQKLFPYATRSELLLRINEYNETTARWYWLMKETSREIEADEYQDINDHTGSTLPLNRTSERSERLTKSMI